MSLPPSHSLWSVGVVVQSTARFALASHHYYSCGGADYRLGMPGLGKIVFLTCILTYLSRGTYVFFSHSIGSLVKVIPFQRMEI
ncbi:hypothetical protein BJY01DRAFT_218739 [Aspergillus pseudoustus]|uniref:Uncharacterized protein n=1 Tax=Aspergillus pseudoustus TaxID=1810923 RepID=A0ABR4JK09_9EURO